MTPPVIDRDASTARSATVATARRALVFATIAVLVVAAAMLIWKSINIFLLLYLAVLIAILLQALGGWVQKVTALPYWAGLSIVLAVSAGLLVLAGVLRAPDIADQIGALREEIPQAVERLRTNLEQYPWGREILNRIPSSGQAKPAQAVPNATNAASGILGALGYVLFVVFTCLFIAFQPRLYRKGFEALFRDMQRERLTHVLDDLWSTLLWWLAARLAAMALVALLVSLGLWLLGLPFALSLGVLAGLLDFVPNFGPIIAALPAVLLAVVHSPEKALYVALLYWGVQMLEGYVITPIAQKKAIDMPPALVISGQFVLGAAIGPLGFVLATPIVAAALVIIRDLYLQPSQSQPEPQ